MSLLFQNRVKQEKRQGAEHPLIVLVRGKASLSLASDFERLFSDLTVVCIGAVVLIMSAAECF